MAHTQINTLGYCALGLVESENGLMPLATLCVVDKLSSTCSASFANLTN